MMDDLMDECVHRWRYVVRQGGAEGIQRICAFLGVNVDLDQIFNIETDVDPLMCCCCV